MPIEMVYAFGFTVLCIWFAVWFGWLYRSKPPRDTTPTRMWRDDEVRDACLATAREICRFCNANGYSPDFDSVVRNIMKGHDDEQPTP